MDILRYKKKKTDRWTDARKDLTIDRFTDLDKHKERQKEIVNTERQKEKDRQMNTQEELNIDRFTDEDFEHS
jgi:hypothetical protein